MHDTTEVQTMSISIGSQRMYWKCFKNTRINFTTHLYIYLFFTIIRTKEGYRKSVFKNINKDISKWYYFDI